MNRNSLTVTSYYTKRVWVRDASVPPGAPARGKINCPCGNAPWSDYGQAQNVNCGCGAIYDGKGNILKAA